MKTITITGSSGFIGQHLRRGLQDVDCRIIPLDIREGVDLMAEETIALSERFDLLIHLAARSFVPDSYEQPLAFFKTNHILTLHALEMCRKHGAAMIYFSSYVYGKPAYLPIDECHPTDGFNPYAQSKLLGEELCFSYNRHFAVPVMIIRPFNIYGPGQDNRYLIPNIIRMAAAGVIELDDPNPRRDFIHVSDVVEFVSRVVKKCIDFRHEIFNLGSGASYSVAEIVNVIIASQKASILYKNKERPNEIPDVICNIAKAEQRLGWKPKKTLIEELKRLMEDFKKLK